ncbi:hypothetical protein [Rhizobium leguminosarum]|uniref:hypothetical protein n=1 Tax=Rhizobium leguminosarum TaxID=384 RepID=UPI00143F78A1|nr:hypothetical protein [Rhizobium leguminosarum]NKL08244.1 hypothetical protein [Rhizobium leguminosarum bv. viciae]NKL82988.1 hypothetical protein [Rhizobium leguminosarum bv. viciae]NKL93905.1 hypothetical protein [Rhizobium leguminosarum bv. viciae]NKM94094.1 hypothetical protein [Rhizobium leguminosarum bv. viciae]
MREQPIGEAVEEWYLSDVGWPPEKEFEVFEAHASLVKAVAGSRGVRYFTAFIIDVPSDAYLGDVQMAIDEAAGEACGILLTKHVIGRDAATGEPVLAEEATRPFKFPCGEGVAKAIASFCDKLKMAGIFP